MARHDLFEIPIFGSFIRRAGAFPLKRNSADIGSLKQALRILKGGRGLLVFPEGSRSYTGELSQDAQAGVGFLAVKSQVPVVPAFIEGSQRALGRGSRFIKPCKIRIYFGKPVYPDKNVKKDSYGKITNQIMQEINLLSKRGGK